MSENSEQNSQDGQSQNQEQQQQSQPQPPEGLDAAFWDAEKGAVKTEDLIKSYGDLNKFKTETEARFASRPASADKYALPDSKALGLPEGAEFEFDEKSPLLATAREAAFAAGLDQAGFEEKFIKPYVADLMAAQAKDEETYQTEMAALGEKAAERIEAINSYLKGALPAEQFEALSGLAVSAKAVEGLEALIGKTKDATMKGASNGSPAGKITQDELSALQADPRYWRDHDPAVVKQVTEGYKQLYPNQIPTSH